nr:integrase, catalytic region, zinc finger, CCHC-type, peptidase aspartic, catalytic [Tanacetum cinerariifolium]
MLDRTNFASWQQRIRLYCRGKENGMNILKLIDEGPFQMGTVREPLSEGTEGAPHLGLPKDIYSLINHYTYAKDIWDNVKMLLERSELKKEDWELQPYDNFKHFQQNKGETIHDYYVQFAKLINDMRNIKMTMSKMQLNSMFVNNMLPEWAGYGGVHNRVGNANLGQARQVKCYNSNDKMLLMQAQENGVALDEDQLLFLAGGQANAIDKDVDEQPMTMSKMQLNSMFVNNMLPEWGRFVTAVKLNRGLKDSNYDQLYAYLKQHEAHANENKMMLDRFTQHTVDPLALMSNVSHQPLYCWGKENGVNILKSIDEGPFQMGTVREPLAERTKGTPHLGPERTRVYSDLSPEDKDRINQRRSRSQLYDDFEHFRQHKGETIHDYYVWFAKLINDMRNIKMTMSKMQLNSKFVNNMLPEWGRFVTAVKLNTGLRDSNYDQLYGYLKKHETHANENKMMLDRFFQHTVDPLALMSNVSHQQPYS